MGGAPQRNRVGPMLGRARLHHQGASGENPYAAELQPESSYVDGPAAAAFSKTFTALPTSATPKITKIALVPGSVPQ
jgi:hypothetical protein